jgi:hypothetical protein
MYEPELRGICEWDDTVLITTPNGFDIGKYKGNARPESESFEIHVIDVMTDGIKDVSFFHKEDLYENTKENAERLKALS